MLWFKNHHRIGQVALVAAMVLGLATPVLAGTVYSWRTEDGTYSFTDDKKQIPAKYKGSVEKKTVGKLRAYERYTPTGKTTDEKYGDRLQERLDDLRGSEAPVATREARVGSEHPISTVLGHGGRTATIVPITSGKTGEPVVIENIRVKPKNSNATRQITVIKQGDRIVQVRKGRMTQQSYMGTNATGPSEEDVLSGRR